MKLLYYGDSPTVATGFGNVSKQLLSELVKKDKNLDITVIGINDRGGWKDSKSYPYKIYPAIYDNYHDLFGIKRLVATLTQSDPEIEKEEYDCLFINYDCFFLWEGRLNGKSLIEYLDEFASGIKNKIIYTPIDNHLMKAEWIESLRFFDHILVPSYYAKRVIESYDKKIGRKTKVVYYSVDTEVFKPLDKKTRMDLRKEYGTAIKVDLTEKYIIGYVGRNQWRKDLPRMIKIFAEFKKIRPEAYLYIHTKPDDLSGDGGNLLDLLLYYGLFAGKDYLFPWNLNLNKGISQGQLNEFYNMMDVFLSCSVGEGFGLPYIEAMAAGTTVVAPNNTTVPELFNIDKTNLDFYKQLREGRGFVYSNSTIHNFGYIDHMRERELGNIDSALQILDSISVIDPVSLIPLKARAREFTQSLTAEKMTNEIYKLIK